ncbi:hypothetical protein [Sagittula sp. S175]|uniref:hypothetical protein n=1 Tax=Sagittula sp. S175 TaxID=3415129 RepID=UPI003C7C77FF
MLTFGDSQMHGFAVQAVQDSHPRLVRRINTEHPGAAARMGPEAVQELVTYVMTRATAFELLEQEALDVYLDLVLALGLEVERDRRVPWVGDTLALRTLSLPRKVVTLRRGLERYGAVLGQRGRVVAQLAQRGSRVPDPDRDAEAFWERVAALWPAYWERQPKLRLNGLLLAARPMAEHYGIPAGGLGAVCLAQLLLGVGCFADPQWRAVFAPMAETPAAGRADAILDALGGLAPLFRED